MYRNVLVTILIFAGMLFFSCGGGDSGGEANGSTDSEIIDTTPPGAITAVVAEATADSVSLTWNNPADDDYAGVRIFIDGIEYTVVPSSLNYITVTGLSAASTYTFSFISIDTAGNAGTAYTKTVTTKNVTYEDDNVYPSAIRFDTDIKTIVVGKEYDLGVTVYPENVNVPITFKAFTSLRLENSETNIIRFDNQKITAIEAYPAELYVFASWEERGEVKYMAKYLVLTIKPAAKGFNLANENVEIYFGETYTLDVSLEPSNALAEISFISNNDKISVSTDGVVSCTADKTEPQTAEITVAVDDLTPKIVKITYRRPTGTLKPTIY